MVTPNVSRATLEDMREIDAQEQEWRDRTALGESMFFGLLGYRRQGKTLDGARLCWETWTGSYLAGRPIRILHLGNLTFGEAVSPAYLANQDPADMGGCIFFIDEVGEILPSGRSASIYQLLVQSNLRQSGHQGLSVVWTAQFERGLARSLTEQTDFIYNIKCTKKRWTTDADIASGRVDPDKDNRCAAWHPGSPFHKRHTGKCTPTGLEMLRDCRKTEKKVTIFAECVTQWGNPLGAGHRIEFIRHCSQRFFPLSRTWHKIDAMEPLNLTADALRDQQISAEEDLVRQVLIKAGKEGYDQAAPYAINETVRLSSGIELTANKLGRLLSHFGVPRRKSNGRHLYNLRQWVENLDEDGAVEPE